MADQMSMVEYLSLGDGDPHLVANVCDSCGTTFFDRRNACAACGARGFSQTRLSNNGAVRTFTIVHRAARGVPAPYVSAVIDLDGGGRVKSNIVNIEPAPEKVSLGMRVQLATYVTATDDDGTEAVAFGYEPESA
ncbi:Zn-ribbon domain-containing OB-fold protein [Candidatus Poriferisodalis sp.]|uniref:Zn-ribbon domain-containing OB-fold protein n=1 Tax=Candidatus Poriferisodalis sp. TaxID=3101277 RepID=UPI003B0104C6